MFVINLEYLVELEKALEVRPLHVEFLNKHYATNTFLFSGRKYDNTGGVIIANLASEQEVHNIMKNDPFIMQNIAKYNIFGFNPVLKSNLISFDVR